MKTLAGSAVSILLVATCLTACSGDHSVHDNNNQNNDNTNQGECGNDIVEGTEECDEGQLNSDSVPDACRTSCRLAFCGDGVADSTEACDGLDLKGETCETVGAFDGGELSCGGSCELDTSLCSACGNGTVEGAEACDEGSGNCDDPGCVCASNCTSPGCGNGIVEAHLGEECDDGESNCDGLGCTCNTSCRNATDACGFPTDGIWLEVDYTNAASVLAPEWRFSPTLGWGESQWAPDGFVTPLINDAAPNLDLEDDVIGRLVHVWGPTSAFRVVVGLLDLTSYSYASACIEGRGMVSGSSSSFGVYNLLNGCGLMTNVIASDPQLHAVGVHLGGCFVAGHNSQALEVNPTSASDELGIVRVRLTFHDAVY